MAIVGGLEERVVAEALRFGRRREEVMFKCGGGAASACGVKVGKSGRRNRMKGVIVLEWYMI